MPQCKVLKYSPARVLRAQVRHKHQSCKDGIKAIIEWSRGTVNIVHLKINVSVRAKEFDRNATLSEMNNRSTKLSII